MDETTRMWMEVIFNTAYLIVVWGLVIAMIRRQSTVPESDKPLTKLFIWAFGLLALGDTGHVGFRVWAYLQGDLETTISLFGFELGLVGLGALSTSITVTLFYALMLVIWHTRYKRPYGWFGWLMFGAAIMRFVLMIPDANQWNSIVPPQPWSLYRNLPLLILGIGVASLMLRDAFKMGDTTFKWIGAFILLSYAFYIPVILFVQTAPTIGMLMIPKTLVYLGIAFVAYWDLFLGKVSSP